MAVIECCVSDFHCNFKRIYLRLVYDISGEIDFHITYIHNCEQKCVSVCGIFQIRLQTFAKFESSGKE